MTSVASLYQLDEGGDKWERSELALGSSDQINSRFLDLHLTSPASGDVGLQITNTPEAPPHYRSYL